MKPFRSIFGFLSKSSEGVHADEISLNYDNLILLDAEELAEGGIKESYDQLLDQLKIYVSAPSSVEEEFSSKNESYSVIVDAIRYEIYWPNMEANESWGFATFAFFEIVNRQLAGSQVKFYAINSGNDLGGMFLTEDQYMTAVRTLKSKTDWPYLPTGDAPWFGQAH